MIGALVAGITGSGGASLSSYESIATATGTGSSGTITFSSIPSTFKHLQIRGIARSTQAIANVDINFQFNGDTGTNYTYHALYGSGSTAGAFGGTGSSVMFAGVAPGANQTADRMGVVIVDILDYGSTTKNKVIRTFNGWDMNGSGDVYINSGMRINTAAITSIEIKAGLGSWTTQTTFALYGIKEA